MMYYISVINLLYSMTSCHYFLKKYFKCIYEISWVSVHFNGFLIYKMLGNWYKQEFSFNLVLFVFFQINRFVFAYFSPCHSRRIGARVLFYFPSANLPGTGTHYIINTPLLFIYNSGFSFSQHICFYIPQENRNLKYPKNSLRFNSDIWYYTVFDAIDILHTLVVSFTANQIWE